jgi:transcriptional regulator NrdR family protein
MSICTCPLCQKKGRTTVIDSRSTGDGTVCYRRYKCGSCKQRFTSYEVYFEQPTIGRSKRSNLGRLAAARILDGAVEELNFNGE